MKTKDFLKTRPEIAKGELELFLCKVLQISRTDIILQEKRVLSDNELTILNRMADDRKTGKPVAYILGEKEFYGRKFDVDENVLIPRPETEMIIEAVFEIVKQNFEGKKLRIVDVGTGSGCIAVTLKLELGDDVEILAADKSLVALRVAKKNASKLGAKIDFCESDLLSMTDGIFDIVVANLPYVDADWDWLDKNTLAFEPEMALYADDKGLSLIFELIRQAKKRTSFIVLEADPCQHEAIINFARKNGFGFIKSDGYIIVLRASQA